jgi:hypothetical protein
MRAKHKGNNWHGYPIDGKAADDEEQIGTLTVKRIFLF